MQLSNKKADILIPLFGGFCFFLSAIEVMIPKPVPFFRIGLANLPILLALNIFSFPAFVLLLAIKVLGQAIISGTIFSYISVFSAAGTFSAGLLMYVIRKLPQRAISFVGISLAGAFVSNTLQLFLAIFIMFGKSAVYIIPPVFSLGTATSIFLGYFAAEFAEKSVWYEQVKNGSFDFTPQTETTEYNQDFAQKSSNSSPQVSRREFIRRSLRKYVRISNSDSAYEQFLRIGSGICLFLILLFVHFLPVQAIILGAALILCAADRQKINFLNIIVMFFAIILFNLFPPMGKILFSIGSVDITSQALLRGIEKAVILEGMIYISKWMLKTKINFKSSIGMSIQASFKVFHKLLSVKNEIKVKMIIPTIDSILLSINKL